MALGWQPVQCARYAGQRGGLWTQLQSVRQRSLSASTSGDADRMWQSCHRRAASGRLRRGRDPWSLCALAQAGARHAADARCQLLWWGLSGSAQRQRGALRCSPCPVPWRSSAMRNLPDGSYLAQLTPQKRAVYPMQQAVWLRVIEYQITDERLGEPGTCIGSAPPGSTHARHRPQSCWCSIMNAGRSRS